MIREQQKSPTGPRRIVVTVQESHQERMSQVCDALTRHGVQIEQVLSELGMITGTVPDAEHAAAAGRVEGVASLDEPMQHRLPPPGSPVQ